jgi:hypothetical protein
MDSRKEPPPSRRHWQGGVIPAERADQQEADFWAPASVEARLDAMTQMVDDALSIGGRAEGHGTSARLQRHLGGVRHPRG